MASFSFERQVAAPPQTVFDVLVDHRGYADILPIRRCELEREGEPAPNGVGAIRAISVLGPPLREEVVAYRPPGDGEPGRFSYKLISGAPVRDHLGTVELTARDGGTHMVYVVRVTPRIPVVVMPFIKQGVKRLVEAVVKESERRSRAGG